MKTRHYVVTLIAMVAITILLSIIVSADGNIYFTESDYLSVSKGNVSSNKITASATGWSIVVASGTSSETITLKNNSTEYTVILSGDMSFTAQGGSYSLNGASSVSVNPSATASPTITLAPGASYTIKITSPKGKQTINFEYTPSIKVLKTCDVTFVEGEFGDYMVDGTVFSALADKTVSMTTDESIELSAPEVTVDGVTYVCIGFADENDVLVDAVNINGTSTFFPTDTCSLHPVYIKKPAVAPFKVNSEYFYLWESAFVEAGTGMVVLAADYTLPTTLGEYADLLNWQTVSENENGTTYTVPSGAKFLVPYGSTDDGSFTDVPADINNFSGKDAITEFKKGTRNFVYRTLTVPTGTRIDCYGSINVNGQRVTGDQPYTGVSAGGYGKIILGEETPATASGKDDLITQLEIQDGGILYCYGYITGNGMVNVLSGGTTHELMQAMDWPGGSNASEWYFASSKKHFLISQFAFQNVEAPIKFNYGSAAYASYTLAAGEETFNGSTASINTGSNQPGMFLMTKQGASILRIYDHTQDRVKYHMNGDISIGNISVTIVVLITMKLDSSSYVLSVPGNFTIIAEDGATVTCTQKLALLPGATAIVEEGGTFNLSGELYLWDVKDWNKSYFFNRAHLVDANGNKIFQNTNPNTAVLPYVATLNGVPARAEALRVGKDGSTECFYMDVINETQSGHLIVDGTMNVNGVLATTSGANLDNYIQGTGTIQLNKISSGALTAGQSSITTITTTASRVNLAGADGVQVFSSTGTYTGLGSEHGHIWYKINEEVEPTCTEGGYIKYYVDDADSYYAISTGETAIGHNYISTVTAPTCTTDGYTTYTCSRCTDSYTDDEIPSSGHTPGDVVVENNVPATPSTAGSYDNVTYCTVCKQETSRVTVEVPATCVHPEWTDATCSAPKTCTACGTTDGDPLPHTSGEAVEENRVESTCKVAGSYDSVVYCSVCGEELSRETKALALSTTHTSGAAVEENRVESTCKVAGYYYSVVDCSVCGIELSREKVDLPLSTVHSPAEAVKENQVPSTCTVAGSYYSVVYCSVCNEELSRTKVDLPLAEHTAGTAVERDRVNSTCTVAGHYYNVVYCTVCQTHEISRTKVDLPLAEHTAGSAVERDRVNSTCTVAGHYYNVIYCTVCQTHEISRTKVDLPLAEHTPGEAVERDRVNSTCTVAGHYYNVVYCTVCQTHEISRTKVDLELAEHTAGEAVKENEVASSCTVAGSHDSVVYCSVCNAELSRTKVDLELAAHTPAEAVEENRVESTCTVAGSYDSVVYCSVCNAELSRTKVDLELAAHTPAEAVEENRVESTCTVAGSYESVVYCSVCDAELSRTTVNLDLAQHTAGEAVTENNVDPTCTATGSYDTVVYCTECEAEMSRVTTTVKENGHTAGTAVKENEVAATCTTDGSYDSVVYCTVTGCGAEISRETKTVTAGGHTNGTAVTENEVAVTCTTDGSYDTVVYCTVCNAETSRVTTTVTATGHTAGEAVKENQTAASCDAPGSYDSVVYCSVCNTKLSSEKITTDQAVGHNYKFTETITAATCTTAGKDKYTCESCGDTEERTVTALGHKLTQVGAKAPTCEVDGYKAYEYCSACDYTTYEKEDATGHDYDAVVTAPTCTADGYTTYICSACGDSYVSDNQPAKGHTPAAAVQENVVEATCKAEGSYDSVVYCSVCNAEISRTPTTINKLDHTPADAVEENRVASTCTVAGSYESVVYCSVCDEELSRDTVALELAQHTAGAAVEEGRVESTCSVAGYYYSVVKCSVCNAELSRTKVDLELAAHTPAEAVKENQKPSTCTVAGSYDSVVKCSKCNAELSRDTVPLELAKHTESAAVEENRTESTCTVAGSYDSVVYCSVCNAELSRTEQELPLAAHTEGEAVEENRVESTCTVAGSYDSVVYCSACNAELSRDTVPLELAQHTESAAVEENRTESTCKVAGSYDSVVYCSVCNAELSRDTVALELAEHISGEVVREKEVPAKCETDGSHDEVTYCTVCGVETSRNSVVDTANGHNYVPVVTPPTCTKDGYTTYTCSDCGNYYVADEVGSTGHTPTEAVKEKEVPSTCTKAGSYDSVVYCSVCDTELSRETIALELAEHTVVIDEALDATCTETGLTQGSHCSLCGEVLVKQETVPALDHSFTHYVSDGNATCTSDGTKTAECDRCDETDTITDEGSMQAHPYDKVVTDPTCSIGGYTTYTCPACGHKKIDDHTDALGHDFDTDNDGVEDGVVTEATCTEGRYTTYICQRCNHFEKRYDAEHPALGHAEVPHEAKAPTCKEVGWDAYVTCSRCEYSTYVELPKHQPTYTDVVTPPTCTEAGYTTRTCVCGDVVITDQVDAIGHKDDADHNNECDVCGATMCNDHDWVVNAPEWKTDSQGNMICIATRTCQNGDHTETAVATVTKETVSPSCTDDGATGYLAIFADNSFVEEKQHEYIIEILPATGHSMTHVEALAPTCTENGNVEHYYCSNCKVCFEDEAGEVAISNVVIGATGHSYESVVTAPTCIARGYTTKTCSVCGDSYKTNYVKALGHRPATDAAEAPTCTETGLSEGKHCSVCNAVIVAQNIIPATGHKYDNNTDVTCNVCGADRRLDCEHDYSVDGCDEIYRWKQCSKCTAINEESRTERKYTITFQGFEGGQDITLQGTYAYDYIITVPKMESYYFEFEGEWTTDDGQVLIPQSKITLGALASLIDGNSDEIYVKGTYKISGLKSDAVLMSMQYGSISGEGNDEIFMTISLYVNVETGMTPAVSKGSESVAGQQIGTMGMYYYSIPLTYEQILDENLTIKVSYVGSDYSEELIISVAEYMRSLTAMFGEEDVAGTKELIEATKEYAEAAQAYFNKDYSKLPSKAPSFDYDEALLSNEYFWEATMNGDLPIAVFSTAAVNMGKTYELVYRATMNLPEGMTLTSAYFILTDDVNALKDRNQEWDEITGTAYEAELVEEGEMLYNQVTIRNVPASEMAVKYVTVYLTFENRDTGEKGFAYSETLKYGVTTYLHRQLYQLQDGTHKDDYANEENKDLWLVATMFDKLRTLAGLADPTISENPSDTPSIEEPTPGDSTD